MSLTRLGWLVGRGMGCELFFVYVSNGMGADGGWAEVGLLDAWLGVCLC